MTNPKNAVIYARYSDEKQTEQSIEGQLRACREYAEHMNLRIVGEYIDRAISGRYSDRPNFQQMITDAKSHTFDYIIVYRLDRFARNRYDSAIYKNELKRNEVRVLSAMERLSDDPESILLEALLEATAEYYSVELAQKVNRGLKESALKCNSTGGTIPLGYKIENKKYVVDEATAPIVKLTFKLYTEGHGKKEICDILNQKGYRNRKNQPITFNTVSSMLKNEKYKGTYHYKDIKIDDGMPAIIDKETFQKAQAISERTKRAPAAHKAKVEYLLSGKLFCGYCGAPMRGESGKSSTSDTVYHYYSCATRKKHHTCNKKNEKKEFIEWYITEQTQLYLQRPDRLNYIADKLIEQYEKEFNLDEISIIQKDIKKIESELQKCATKLLETEVPALIEAINTRAKDLDAQLQNARISLSKMQAYAKQKLSKEQIIRWIQSFSTINPTDPKEQKRIIDTFVNAVYIKDDEFTIYYNTQNCKQVSFTDHQNYASGTGESSNNLCFGSPKQKSTLAGCFFVLPMCPKGTNIRP